MSLLAAKKILFCLRYGIGDLVMELPALTALRAAVPRARLTALGAWPAMQLLEGENSFEALVSVQDFGFRHWGDRGTPQARESFRSWLWQENFDLVLDPSHAVRGIAEVIWEDQPEIFDSGRANQDAALAAGADGAAVVRGSVRAGWGLSLPDIPPRLQLSPSENAFAARVFDRLGWNSPPVGFSPVASSPLKRMPADRLAAILEHVAGLGIPVLFFCGPDDPGRTLSEFRLPRPEVATFGGMHLRRVAALLAACRLFIGHDTGLMHLAASVGTPLVALFGPTSPDIYLPRQVQAVALGGRDDCRWRRSGTLGPSDCVVAGHCLAGKRSCIDDISPSAVNSEIVDLLTASHDRRLELVR